ncbi:hypothetical protein CLF_100131 [Clonorchis sinensis]|uniref:Endonuclease/exonuclease/phosphatase domain-containing protein n=1 Tax=Clonorchis sinensis TaxID=79923 RepID=G7Y2R3_CLOSI|nr:hypothetical protein CLF_100131 [Clonorchis sinensis]
MDLSMILINARSLLPKVHNLSAIVAITQPSLICVTETWVSVETPDTAVSIPGYNTRRCDRRNSRGGGCAIYSKSELRATSIDDCSLEGIPRAIWISIEQTKRLVLSCITSCRCSVQADTSANDGNPVTHSTEIKDVVPNTLAPLIVLIKSSSRLPKHVSGRWPYTKPWATFLSYHFTQILMVGDFNALNACWMELQRFAAALTKVVQQSARTQHVVALTRYRTGQLQSLLDLVITNGRQLDGHMLINAILGHSDHGLGYQDLFKQLSLHHEGSARKVFAVLLVIRRNLCRITRMDLQILYGAYVRSLLEYANQVVHSGRKKDVILIERVKRANAKMTAGLKSVD